MNFWKFAFLGLIGVIVLVIGTALYWVTAPIDSGLTASEESKVSPTDSVLYVETTAEDFEKLTMKYLSKELENSSLPVDFVVNDQIQLFSEIIAFGTTVSVSMKFEPEVNEQGNIHLKQTEVNVGRLNLPPSMVLRLMNEAVDFPPWMVVRPKEEEIFVDLSNLTIASGAKVKAKEIDLPNDRILLEVIVPND